MAVQIVKQSYRWTDDSAKALFFRLIEQCEAISDAGVARIERHGYTPEFAAKVQAECREMMRPIQAEATELFSRFTVPEMIVKP